MNCAITCACGAVKGQATGAGDHFHACHCGMCRKWSGGVFMAVTCDAVSFDDDSALNVWVSSDWGERVSCGSCGSTLVWRMRDGSHRSVSIQAFEDPSRFTFGEEIMVDEKPDAYDFVGDHGRLTTAEVMARHGVAQEDGQ